MVRQEELLCEGKTKRLYATDQQGLAVMFFKDEVTAYEGLKRGRILGKGAINNAITHKIYTLLKAQGIETHYVAPLDDVRCVVRTCEMIPLKIRVHNWVAGTLTERVGLPAGTKLDAPVIEMLHKSSRFVQTPITEDEAVAKGLVTAEEMHQLTETSLTINRILCGVMHTVSVEVVDIKMEYGRVDGHIILADEITPDNARFWDASTHEPLDIDCFKRDLGETERAYQELFARMKHVEEIHA